MVSLALAPRSMTPADLRVRLTLRRSRRFGVAFSSALTAWAPPHLVFRGSIARLVRSLSTLRGPGRPGARARLGSGCSPGFAGQGSHLLGDLRLVSERCSSSSHWIVLARQRPPVDSQRSSDDLIAIAGRRSSLGAKCGHRSPSHQVATAATRSVVPQRASTVRVYVDAELATRRAREWPSLVLSSRRARALFTSSRLRP